MTGDWHEWTAEGLERLAVAMDLTSVAERAMQVAEERARTIGPVWYAGMRITWCAGDRVHLPHYAYIAPRPGREMLSRDVALTMALAHEMDRAAVSAERAAPPPAGRPGGAPKGWAGAA